MAPKISSKFLDAKAAGPWTTLWVTRINQAVDSIYD